MKWKWIFWNNVFTSFWQLFFCKDVCHYAWKIELLLTNRRDRLLKGVEVEYLHKQITGSKKVTKCARYVQLVFLVKESTDYEIVLT